jgi:predicted membrane GTPase involved in stress response
MAKMESGAMDKKQDVALIKNVFYNPKTRQARLKKILTYCGMDE